MIIYRLALESFKDDMSGTGSKLFGGRWNVPGIPAVYATQNISLAVLEILVNAGKHHIPPSYYLLKLDAPDNLSMKLITNDKLKEKWYRDFEYAQFIGSNFLESGKEAILKVPSAIIKEEYNFVLNPAHAEFKKISIKESVPFDFDIRLFNQ
ncbi:MAG: RES family NAD+ phosphorylase [Chitinophagaceae bacterium]|nr:RES family NAD+ phosphorylase [Chitinophagaceae bacterium]